MYFVIQYKSLIKQTIKDGKNDGSSPGEDWLEPRPKI